MPPTRDAESRHGQLSRQSQFPNGRERAMAKNLRRAAKKAINARSSHGLLGLFIFDEKLVCENYKKLVNSKANSTLSLLKWARNEENKAIKDVFSKVFEVTSIWTTIWADFLDEYQKYRSTFKELLREERELDEVIKQDAACAAKLNKLQKQIQQVKDGSSKVVTPEMAEVISQAEKAHAELEVKHTQHEILKARRLRSSLHAIADGLQKWAEQTISVSSTYRNLANLIPDTPTQFTEENVYPGAGQSRTIVSKLSSELKIKPELSAKLATAAGHAPHNAYLYAMSCPLKENPTQSEFEYATPSTADGDATKLRKPQPLPKTKPKPGARKSRGHQFARPVSDGELRSAPPSTHPLLLPQGGSSAVPAQQPSGKLWYARSKLLGLRESDSEDSDGYTEPLQYPTHSISDSVLNKLAEREESSDREQAYTQLLSQMQKQDINENPAYVDLLG